MLWQIRGCLDTSLLHQTESSVRPEYPRGKEGKASPSTVHSLNMWLGLPHRTGSSHPKERSPQGCLPHQARIPSGRGLGPLPQTMEELKYPHQAEETPKEGAKPPPPAPQRRRHLIGKRRLSLPPHTSRSFNALPHRSETPYREETGSPPRDFRVPGRGAQSLPLGSAPTRPSPTGKVPRGRRLGRPHQTTGC